LLGSSDNAGPIGPARYKLVGSAIGNSLREKAKKKRFLPNHNCDGDED
jgi:hypothetical protein